MRFIGQAHVQRAGVRLRIDGDGGNMQIAAGANNAHRDLAAICNQNLAKHLKSYLVLCSLYFENHRRKFGTNLNRRLSTKYQVLSTKYKARPFRRQRNLLVVADRNARRRERPADNRTCEGVVVRRAAERSDSRRLRLSNCKT